MQTEIPTKPDRDTAFSEGILDEAKRITAGERQRDYDHPLPNHNRIAVLWNAYLSMRKGPRGRLIRRMWPA